MPETSETALQQFESEGNGRYDIYPEYESPSGNNLQEVPTHWEKRSFQYWADKKNNKGDDDEMDFITLEHINSVTGDLIDDFEWEKKESGEYYLFEPGDVLFGKLRPYLRKYYRVNRRGCCGTDLMVLRPRSDVKSKFLYYYLHSEDFIQFAEANSHGVKMPRTSWTKISSAHFRLPPIEEQNAIVEFLSDKTEDLDELIGLKNNLIGLLGEKRSALITEVVTKGLDSDVETKDSGVPGLGSVPESWDLIPLKFSSRNISVGIVQKPSQYYVNDGIPALRSLNVKSNEIVQDELVYISEESNKELKSTQIYAGDLVSVRSGEPGTTAVVPEELDGVNCIDLIIIREPDGYIPEFLSYMMNSEASTSQIEAGTEGSAQQHFNVGEVKDLIFPKPDVEEQQEILDWLSPRLKEIDKLEEKVKEGIERLKEYRTALITDAVTGQIDVRGEV